METKVNDAQFLLVGKLYLTLWEYNLFFHPFAALLSVRRDARTRCVVRPEIRVGGEGGGSIDQSRAQGGGEHHGRGRERDQHPIPPADAGARGQDPGDGHECGADHGDVPRPGGGQR